MGTQSYRSSRIWVWFGLMLPAGLAIAGLFVAASTYLLVVTLLTDLGDTPRWFQLAFALGFFAIGGIGGSIWIVGAVNACHRFTLREDGLCEFRSVFRRQRVWAQAIVSIELDETMTIVRYRGGKLHLLEPDEFADFVSRLRRVNPGVEIDGPERWERVRDGEPA